jgi:hypothetical protein
MLLTQAQVDKAFNLSVQEVNEALARNGYFDPMLTASCVGMTCKGVFVYQTTFFDRDESRMDNGKLYIKYEQHNAPVPFITADY